MDEGMIFGRPLSKYGWKPMARVRKGQGYILQLRAQRYFTVTEPERTAEASA